MKLFLPEHAILLENQFPVISPKINLDEIDELATSMDKNMNLDLKVTKDVLNSFQLKDNLNPDIWTGSKLNPEIQTKLVQIAKDFLLDLSIDSKVQIKDIIFTGSLANFNWSKYSDIDLHVVIDFDQFDADIKLVEDYFKAQKNLWNNEHVINIKGFPIEIYVQNAPDKLQATAIYSVLNNKWILKPNRETFTLDKKSIKSKADKFISQLRDIKSDYSDKQYKSVIDKTKKLKDKIKQMRFAGLEKGGEFSNENLVFKILRRIPFMDVLDSFKAKAYDNLMSVAETINEANILNEDGVVLIKGKQLEDGTCRLYAAYVRYTNTLNRTKTDSSEGKSVTMVTLNPKTNIYRIKMENDKLMGAGVNFPNTPSKETNLGMRGNSIGLNYNKTPFHTDSLKYKDIATCLNALKSEITNLPNIKWIG